jgi:ABC-type cobalamin transport system ATPase subunit
MEKYPIDPARIRHLPPRFSWLDQRLVTDEHLRHCGRSAQGLYLFLAVVSDASGMSYYSDRSMRLHLNMEQAELATARAQLIECALVIYERPLYQLLSLDPHKADSRPRTGTMHSVADFLRIPSQEVRS